MFANFVDNPTYARPVYNNNCGFYCANVIVYFKIIKITANIAAVWDFSSSTRADVYAVVLDSEAGAKEINACFAISKKILQLATCSSLLAHVGNTALNLVV